MAILIDGKKRVLVQGITGREGQARTRLMREYQPMSLPALRLAKVDKRFWECRSLILRRKL